MTTDGGGLAWRKDTLWWGTHPIATLRDVGDGTCRAEMTSPASVRFAATLHTRPMAIAWAETQARTLLVLEGHSPDGANA